jgi:ZIP family zinc transporter
MDMDPVVETTLGAGLPKMCFQATPALGVVIAAAVLTHDFSDGVNTVNVLLRNGGTWRQASRWLLVDALAPALGVTATLVFSVSAATTALLIAVFVGSFLYLSASDLIPESHHRHPRALTTQRWLKN